MHTSIGVREASTSSKASADDVAVVGASSSLQPTTLFGSAGLISKIALFYFDPSVAYFDFSAKRAVHQNTEQSSKSMPSSLSEKERKKYEKKLWGNFRFLLKTLPPFSLFP